MYFSKHTVWTRAIIIKYTLLLFILCLLAYWPLSFSLFSLKNDAIIYFLPVRYTISESISNGYWPFWSPYLNLGYPLHMDMQSGVWNPFVQFISLFGSYTLKTLSYETLLYVYISGLGMLFLLKHLKFAPAICFLLASAYMLSGFNSDSSQFLYWISGAAFLPFTFLFYYRMINERKWQTSILFGFSLYLFFTTAYPGEFLLLFYFLLAYTIWDLFKNRKEWTRKIYLHLLRNLFIAFLLFLILSLPAILSYLEFLKVMNRGSGVSYDLAMSNPLHPLLLFSYILPLPVWRAPDISITDPLGRNCFIGLIPFSLLICSFFTKLNHKLSRFLKISFLITLLLSLGEFGLLRPLSYYFLPYMDTFRHPSIAKLFTNFSGLILAALYLQSVLSNNSKAKFAWIPFAFIIGVCILLVSWAFVVSNLTLDNLFLSTTNRLEQLKDHFEKLSFLDLTLLNIAIQLPFIFLIFLAFIKRVRFQWLVWGGVINCFIHAALFQPFTVVRTQSQHDAQAIINHIVQPGFPKPDLNASIHSTSIELSAVLKDGPLTTYSKKIAHTHNFTAPATLKSHNMFWNNEKLRNLIFSYPLLYRVDTIMKTYDSSYTSLQKIAVVKNSISIPIESHVQFETNFKKFTPNQWSLSIKSNKPGFYCLQQNDMQNWSLYIDGKKQEIIRTNYTFIGFTIDKGQHNIDLTYDAPNIRRAFWVSLITSLIAILFMIYTYLKKHIKA